MASTGTCTQEFTVPAWVPGPIAGLFKRPIVRKLWKYSMTSVFGVTVGQSLIFLFASILDWELWLANLAAVSLTSIPTFFICKHWVWRKSGRASLYAEALPFWIMNLFGLVLSHFSILWLESRWPGEPLLANVGNGMGFGMMWIAKFFVLDRVLFKVTHEHPEGPAPFI